MSLVALQERIRAAAERAAPLRLRGGGSKDFYGNEPRGEILDTRDYAGIVSYEPTELVVTARCGTALSVLENTLKEKGQCLPFEPPHFGAATVGGCVAAGLSGPRRASAGALRDFLLGTKIVDGRGRVLSFGGQVMKNVAGYDVSRLLAGSLGTLGVICEVSLKVLPVAPATATLRFSMSQQEALDQLNVWGGQPLPLNASAWWSDTLLVRLRGALAAVNAAIVAMGGELVDGTDVADFWRGLREHTDEYFVGAHRAVDAGAGRLWRLSVPQTAAPLALSGEQLIEWGGAQRWLASSAPASQVREAAARAGGHATLFKGVSKSAGVFAPLTPPLDRIHRELKKAFDPAGIFNPGRLYRDL